MIIDLVLGTTSVLGLGAGVWALVFYRKNGNGHAAPQVVQPVLVGDVDELAVKLDSLPEKLEQGLAPVFEGFVRQVAALPPPEVPPELVSSMQRVATKLEAWSLIRAFEPAPPSELVEASRKLDRLTEQIEALIEMGPPPPVTVEPKIALELPTVESKLDRIGDSLAEILAVGRNRPLPPPPRGTTWISSGGTSGGGTAGGSGGNAAPPRRTPPPSPRVPPTALPATPSIPAPYVAGSVFVPAEASNLLELIQQQLASNCPGSAVELQLSADVEILVGAASALGGPLTSDNYAYKLEAGGPPRLYRSSYPGTNTPLGELQVMGGGYLHVEVVT